jgi:hypothetical protein
MATIGRGSAGSLVGPASRPWLLLSVAAAVLAIVGSITALAVDSVYRDLTSDFLAQAQAQDIVNLVFVSPALFAAALLALRGSLRPCLFWLGVVTFTVYNHVVYVFAVPFGSSFLLLVAVLGLSLFALIGGGAVVSPTKEAGCAMRPRSPRDAPCSPRCAAGLGGDETFELAQGVGVGRVGALGGA